MRMYAVLLESSECLRWCKILNFFPIFFAFVRCFLEFILDFGWQPEETTRPSSSKMSCTSANNSKTFGVLPMYCVYAGRYTSNCRAHPMYVDRWFSFTHCYLRIARDRGRIDSEPRFPPPPDRANHSFLKLQICSYVMF